MNIDDRSIKRKTKRNLALKVYRVFNEEDKMRMSRSKKLMMMLLLLTVMYSSAVSIDTPSSCPDTKPAGELIVIKGKKEGKGGVRKGR
jgi:hypothetical protein